MGYDGYQKWEITSVATMPDKVIIDADNGDEKITKFEFTKWFLNQKHINWQDIQKGRVLKIVGKGTGRISATIHISSIELVAQ